MIQSTTVSRSALSRHLADSSSRLLLIKKFQSGNPAFGVRFVMISSEVDVLFGMKIRDVFLLSRVTQIISRRVFIDVVHRI